MTLKSWGEHAEDEPQETMNKSEGSRENPDKSGAALAAWAKLVSTIGSLQRKESFTVRDCWQQAQQKQPTDNVSMWCSLREGSIAGRDYVREAKVDLLRQSALLGNRGSALLNQMRSPSKLMIHPDSFVRMIWAIFGMLFITADALMLTMAVFGISALTAVELLDFSYWFADVLVSFRIGSDPWLAANRYLRSWFAFDIVVLSAQGMLLFGPSDVTSVGFLRYLRLVRYFRIFRLMKLNSTLRQLIAQMQSEWQNLIVKLFGLMMAIALWIHLSATAWYAIGSSSEDGWPVIRGDFDAWPMNYLMALHWSASQMGGNTDLYPTNKPGERSFAVIHLLLSLCLFAIIVSKVTNIMHRIQQARYKHVRLTHVAQGFANAHGISIELSMRVRRYLQRGQVVQEMVDRAAQEAELFARLPCHLRRALLEEARWAVLRKQLIFLALAKCDQAFARQLMCDALNQQVRIPDEFVFQYGSLCNKYLVVASGTLHYLHYTGIFASIGRGVVEGASSSTYMGMSTSGNIGGPGLEHCSTSENSTDDMGALARRQQQLGGMDVRSGTTFCEAVLWTTWAHRGDLEPRSEVSLFSMDVDVFVDLVMMHKTLQEGMTKHAARFVRVLQTGPEQSDLFDSEKAMALARASKSPSGDQGPAASPPESPLAGHLSSPLAEPSLEDYLPAEETLEDDLYQETLQDDLTI